MNEIKNILEPKEKIEWADKPKLAPYFLSPIFSFTIFGLIFFGVFYSQII